MTLWMKAGSYLIGAKLGLSEGPLGTQSLRALVTDAVQFGSVHNQMEFVSQKGWTGRD